MKDEVCDRCGKQIVDDKRTCCMVVDENGNKVKDENGKTKFVYICDDCWNHPDEHR